MWHEHRSLKLNEWPPADQSAWEAAFRPGLRFRRGGVGSRLAPASRERLCSAYGRFLGFLQRTNSLAAGLSAADLVTPANVGRFSSELADRVSSVTHRNYIHHLHMAVRCIDPTGDYAWLAEAQKDLAFVMQPRSKLDRLVLTERLTTAGLKIVRQAKQLSSEFAQAREIRNGMMVALLSLRPLRRANFAGLDLGTTLKQVNTHWWITLPGSSTKNRKPTEKRVPDLLKPALEFYIERSRPVLLGGNSCSALWISGKTGAAFSENNLGRLISRLTKKHVGVSLSPHLFRTSAATSAAYLAPDMPFLAMGVLDQSDPRVAQEHYTRTSSLAASGILSGIVRAMRDGGEPK